MKQFDERIFLEDVEVPEVVQRKADEAFDIIRKEGRNTMKKKSEEKKSVSFRTWIKPMIAAAACAALVITAAALGGNTGRENNEAAIGVESSEPGTAMENRANISFPDFSIAAYAEGEETAGANGGSAVFADVGFGADGYTGILFNVMGGGITDVDITIDKGELYSAVIEDTTEDAVRDWMAQGMPDRDADENTDTLVETLGLEQREEDTEPQRIRMYHCTKRGGEIREQYDARAYYGFYIPDSIREAVSDGTDQAEAKHEMMRAFDGAVLRVTVSYSDGSSSTKLYELTVEKLAQDGNGKITREIWTGGDEGAFVYGILAEEK